MAGTPVSVAAAAGGLVSRAGCQPAGKGQALRRGRSPPSRRAGAWSILAPRAARFRSRRRPQRACAPRRLQTVGGASFLLGREPLAAHGRLRVEARQADEHGDAHGVGVRVVREHARLHVDGGEVADGPLEN